VNRWQGSGTSKQNDPGGGLTRVVDTFRPAGSFPNANIADPDGHLRAVLLAQQTHTIMQRRGLTTSRAAAVAAMQLCE
jgi:hypothetical protein